MQDKKAFCGILACANVLICALFCAIKGFGVALLISFEFAFFATLFIIILSFLSYKKNVFKKVSTVGQMADTTKAMNVEQKFTQAVSKGQIFVPQNDKSPKNAEFITQIQPQRLIFCQKPLQVLPKILKFKATNDEFKASFKGALKNFGVFFSLAKLCAYAFLALGFLTLQRQNLLDIVGFLGGVSSVLVSVLAFAGLCVHKQR